MAIFFVLFFFVEEKRMDGRAAVIMRTLSATEYLNLVSCSSPIDCHVFRFAQDFRLAQTSFFGSSPFPFSRTSTSRLVCVINLAWEERSYPVLYVIAVSEAVGRTTNGDESSC